MKYKKIKIFEDKILGAKLKAVNTSEVARKVGVSPQYLYEVMNDSFILTEKRYLQVKEAVELILQK